MGKGRILIVALAAICAVSAFYVHAPGEMSYDSSVQVYEALTGQSVSWNPPFMSALLRWLGGGALATSLFVAINCVLTYASLAALWTSPKVIRAGILRTCIAAAIIINPLIFAYVGIVWKDVLFATWLISIFSLCIAADRIGSDRSASVMAFLIIALISVGPLIRQQGALVAPIVLVAPLSILWRTTPSGSKLGAVFIGVLLFLCAAFAANVAADSTIKGNGGKSMSFGPSAVAMFDIAGVIVRLSPDGALRAVPGLTRSDYEKLRELYTPTRADFLNAVPAIPQHMIAGAHGASLPVIWLRIVPSNPVAYAKHRARVMAELLNIGNIYSCLPIHVGIEGQNDYLADAGIAHGTGRRAQIVYQIAVHFFNTPIWRNWFYALTLCAVAVYVLAKKIPSRPIVIIHVVALILFLAAFVPTAIACDFRYLYPVIPTLSGILMFLVGSSGKADAEQTHIEHP